ncbi:MAG: hypothetical protein AAB289_08585 [Chloroflexota bacterium]
MDALLFRAGEKEKPNHIIQALAAAVIGGLGNLKGPSSTPSSSDW